MKSISKYALALSLIVTPLFHFGVFAQEASSSGAAAAATSEIAETLTPTLGTDSGFSHHRTAVGDVRLHYVRGGEGEPLILLHGWPTTWWEWHKVMPGLAENFDVIAVDTRGLGDTTRPEGGYDKETIGGDIVALARKLGLTRFSIAGHDLGGQIAFAIARNNPDMVQRLAILDVPLMGMPYSEAIAPWHFAFNKVPDLPEQLTQDRERLFLDQFWSGFTYNPRGFEETDIQEFLRTYTAVGAMRAGFNYYRAFEEDAAANKAWFDAGNKLDMPVLWLGGEGTPEADIAGAGIISTGGLLGMQLENAATDLRGQSLNGCGHWLASECPDVTEELLLEFFAGR
jgi:pimeloyl-ACP methyl ester carboxylesterase